MKNDLWSICQYELAHGAPCVLATVLERHGSAPRGAGAFMLALRDGRTLGTVGGGAVEHAIALRCMECINENRSAMLEYSLSPGDAQALGMVCGGEVRVHCHYLSPNDVRIIEVIDHLTKQLAMDGSVWLLRAFETDGTVAETNVYACNELLMPCSVILQSDAKALCRRQAILHDHASGSLALFALPVRLSGFTYVFGGGHIAQSLVPLLGQLDFAPIVFDDRAEYANDRLFPTAERVVLGDFEHIDRSLSLTEEDCAVIMTRGHAYDHILLTQVLRSAANYIGLIGSKSKIAHTKALLLEEGFSEDDFARVHTPVGLPIGAETPMEIAVSVAAEMILHRARRNGSRKA